MEIRIEPDESAVARLAADFVEAALADDRPTIGLATGATPVPTYAELIRRHREHDLRLDHAVYVLLDEYVGLPLDHPASCRGFIHHAFTDQARIPSDSIHVPPADAADPTGAGARYEQLLAELPTRRLQILGIGRNGHIGFNEPSSSLASRTRVTTLCAETLADARHHFDDNADVPSSGLTMGIGTILDGARVRPPTTSPRNGDSRRSRRFQPGLVRLLPAVRANPTAALRPSDMPALEHGPSIDAIADAARRHTNALRSSRAATRRRSGPEW